ncbi:hypothetical protein NMY3_00329 [Candidatus Nitrosocosmicus oleophilus]|uniref:Uncharacterized protein n=1 Tax=Candidatus Nitrosocosmicus oleophilus TaxID=1353260 RepID=A0A654LW44_9ARCH|nr:hypothetical protein NMY3_00329 [Candidatus Nitrosocosmicus oleophilus]
MCIVAPLLSLDCMALSASSTCIFAVFPESPVVFEFVCPKAMLLFIAIPFIANNVIMNIEVIAKYVIIRKDLSLKNTHRNVPLCIKNCFSVPVSWGETKLIYVSKSQKVYVYIFNQSFHFMASIIVLD